MNKKPKPPNSKLPLPAAASTVKPKNEAPRPLFRRRSKSVCDLKSAANKENVAAKKPTIVKPVTTIPAKRPLERGAKRPATTKIDEKDAPKVAKVVKPAPYDYKARYMLEKEEHVKLKEKFKVMKTESESMSEKLSNYDAISTRFEELKKCYDQKCVKGEELARINATLKIKCDRLEFEHKDLTDRYDGVCRSLQMIQRENDTLSRQNVKVEGDLRAAKDDICKRIEAIQKLKTKLGEMDDQRRRLHDEIQCLKGNIRVFCRIRPPRPEERNEQQCQISCSDPCNVIIRRNRDAEGRSQDMVGEFTFDHVFTQNANQSDVFDELSPLVQSALDGYHVCIFAYGQTGSGKTYTMQGEQAEKDLGIIPRSIDLLFRAIEASCASGWQFRIMASFIEIYNENVKDLLNPNSDMPHDIRYNEGKGITITNLTKQLIGSASELKQLMAAAHRNRATAATNFNEHSSRSHALTKITLESSHLSRSNVYLGSLNFVDLAGSECAKTSPCGQRLAETKHINKSLSELGNVMLALHNKSSYVPYRNSKLTYLLQSSLGGNSKTLMFVNISPLDKAFCESLNSLRFAAQVKEVKITAKRNKMKLAD